MDSFSFKLSFGEDELLFLNDIAIDQMYSIQRIGRRKEQSFLDNEVGVLVAKVINGNIGTSSQKRKIQNIDTNLKKVIKFHLIGILGVSIFGISTNYDILHRVSRKHQHACVKF